MKLLLAARLIFNSILIAALGIELVGALTTRNVYNASTGNAVSQLQRHFKIT
jgi:hypothetical protein